MSGRDDAAGQARCWTEELREIVRALRTAEHSAGGLSPRAALLLADHAQEIADGIAPIERFSIELEADIAEQLEIEARRERRAHGLAQRSEKIVYLPPLLPWGPLPGGARSFSPVVSPDAPAVPR